MNPRFVRKGILTDDRLVTLHEHPRDTGDQPTHAAELRCVDPGFDSVIVLTRLEGHDDLFKRRIPCPLTEPVDCALHLSCSGFDRREAIRHGQSKIVVTVRTDYRLMNIRNVLLQMRNDFEIMHRSGVPDCIRNVDRGRTGIDRLLHDLAEKVEFGSRGIFGREFNILTE